MWDIRSWPAGMDLVISELSSNLSDSVIPCQAPSEFGWTAACHPLYTSKRVFFFFFCLTMTFTFNMIATCFSITRQHNYRLGKLRHLREHNSNAEWMAFSSCVCAMNLGRASYPATWKWESNCRSPAPLISGQIFVKAEILSPAWAKKYFFSIFEEQNGSFPHRSLHPPIPSMGRASTANGVPIPNWWFKPALLVVCWWRTNTLATALLQHPANLSPDFFASVKKTIKPEKTDLSTTSFESTAFPFLLFWSSSLWHRLFVQAPGILATKNTIAWNKWFSSVTISG